MNPLLINSKSCIIFDFDGVIAETETHRFMLIKKLLQNRGVNTDHLNCEKLSGIPTAVVLRSGFPLLSHNTIEEIVSERHNIYFSNLDKYCVLRSGVVDLMRNLQLLDVQLVLATANQSWMIEKMLAHLGLLNIFSPVLSQKDFVDLKTGQKNYSRVLQLLECEPCECVVIEDSRTGVLAAKDAGIFCIGIVNEYVHKLRCSEGIAVRDIEQLREVFGI